MKKMVNTLMVWYSKEGRDLPWRGTQNPYHILVSEIMLQQTQVSRVVDFYNRWLERFPNWEALSEATNGEVIEMWAGLGYNRRALMLRDIAKQVFREGVPSSRDEWLNLKGIGPYTSAALTVFSLREPVMPIDTNTRRVISRMLLGEPYPDLKQDELIEEAGKSLLEHEEFYDVPQALFDLATQYCLKKPNCADCPLQTSCKIAPMFLVGEIEVPERMTKKPHERHHRDKPNPDRIYRGRILKVIREEGSRSVYGLGPDIDPEFDTHADQEWVEEMVDRLAKDNLVIKRGDIVQFPK